MKPTFVCHNCGSGNIQCLAWININTKQVMEEFCGNEPDDTFCPDCQQNALAVTQRDYNDSCSISILHPRETCRPHIEDMLKSLYGKRYHEYTYQHLVYALDDATINDICRRMNFIADLMLAHEQVVDQCGEVSEELMGTVRGGETVTCRINGIYPEDLLSATVPNRSRQYPDIFTLLSEIKDMNKKFLFTRVEKMSELDEELPF